MQHLLTQPLSMQLNVFATIARYTIGYHHSGRQLLPAISLHQTTCSTVAQLPSLKHMDQFQLGIAAGKHNPFVRMVKA
jgi:hypothetical protein